ncbi:hypothetical protein C6P40_005437, partial [Pichia californica]
SSYSYSPGPYQNTTLTFSSGAFAPTIAADWNTGPYWTMVIPEASLISSLELELVSDSNITPTADSYTVYIVDDSNHISALKNYNAESSGISWTGSIKGKYLEIVLTPAYDHSASLLSADFVLTLDVDLNGIIAKRD